MKKVHLRLLASFTWEVLDTRSQTMQASQEDTAEQHPQSPSSAGNSMPENLREADAIELY